MKHCDVCASERERERVCVRARVRVCVWKGGGGDHHIHSIMAKPREDCDQDSETAVIGVTGGEAFHSQLAWSRILPSDETHQFYRPLL